MNELELTQVLDLLSSGGITLSLLGWLVYVQVAALRRAFGTQVLDGSRVVWTALGLGLAEGVLLGFLGKLSGALTSFDLLGWTLFGVVSGLVAVGLASSQRQLIDRALPVVERLLTELLTRALKQR